MCVCACARVQLNRLILSISLCLSPLKSSIQSSSKVILLTLTGIRFSNTRRSTQWSLFSPLVFSTLPSGKMPPFRTLQFYTGLCFLVRAPNTTGSPWRASVISDHTEQAGILEGEDFFIFLEETWLGSCCSVFCSLKFCWVYKVFRGDHHVYIYI